MLNEIFRQRMEQMLGDEAAIFLQSLDTVAPVSVRMHPGKAASSRSSHFSTSGTEPVPWAPDGFYLQDRPVFTLDPLLHAGAYYVQEASSMLLGHVVRAIEAAQSARSAQNSPVRTVLDACASPGGKTTLLASALPNSFIVANEVISSRLPALRENVIKWGTGNIAVTSSEVNRFSAMPGFFDLIVVDAPCSGEGLFRKQPEARLEWSAENARHCALRQRRILMDAWPALRPGGCLIYSTCTFNPDENEQNLAWLAGQTGAETLPVEMPGGWGVSEIRLDDATGYACYPHRVKGEGFFIAAVRKPDGNAGQDGGFAYSDHPAPDAYATQTSQDSHAEMDIQSKNSNRSGRQSAKPARVKKHQKSHRGQAAPPYETISGPAAVRLDQWYTGNDNLFIRYGKMIHRISREHQSLLDLLHAAMPVRYAGIETAQPIRDELKPAHPAALSPFLDHSRFPCYDLDTGQALSFLRSEPLTPPPGNGKGWVLARYKGLGLGWLKHAGNRMNNYYPQAWRIRMQTDKL